MCVCVLPMSKSKIMGQFKLKNAKSTNPAASRFS